MFLYYIIIIFFVKHKKARRLPSAHQVFGNVPMQCFFLQELAFLQ